MAGAPYSGFGLFCFCCSPGRSGSFDTDRFSFCFHTAMIWRLDSFLRCFCSTTGPGSMPKKLNWRLQPQSLQCPANGQGVVSLRDLHNKLTDLTLSDDPPFMCAALNPGHVKHPNGAFMEIATACISCSPKCSFTVRLCCEDALPNFTVSYSGAHDETSFDRA